MENIKIAKSYLEAIQTHDAASARGTDAPVIASAPVSIAIQKKDAQGKDVVETYEMGEEQLLVVPQSEAVRLGLRILAPSEQLTARPSRPGSVPAQSLSRADHQNFQQEQHEQEQQGKTHKYKQKNLTLPARRKPVAHAHQPLFQSIAAFLVKEVPDFLAPDYLFRSQVLQRANPPTLSFDAIAAFSFVEPTDVGIQGLTQNVRVVADKEKVAGLNGLRMDMSKLSERCYFNLGTHAQKDALIGIFDYYSTPLRKAPRSIDVFVTELRPEDTRKDWFRPLAKLLAQTKVRCIVRRDGIRVAHEAGVHGHVEMSALTATAMTMKVHGDVKAFTAVFSYAPAVVAADLRARRMGRAVGTIASRALLASMMAQIAVKDYRVDSKLIQPVVDVLVAHLGRHDHQTGIIKQDKKDEVIAKLTQLVDMQLPNQPTELTKYLKMAAVREGLVYAAVRAYARDVDKINERHLAMIDGALAAVGDVAASAAGIASGPAGIIAAPVAKSIVGGVRGLIKNAMSREWAKGELDKAIGAHFDVEVDALATQGFVKGVERELTQEEKLQLKDYVEIAGKLAARMDVRI